MSLLPAKHKLQLIVGNSDTARLLRTKKWELTNLNAIEKCLYSTTLTLS